MGERKLFPMVRGHLDCKSVNTSKDIFSKTAGPISIKFHMQLPDYGGTKVYTNGPWHMTRMVVMPRYDKNFKNFPSPTTEL